jgi:Cytochrome b5-like Heme/Steroid binding domain
VAKHRSPDDCWIIVDGDVYDVTDFLDSHPGGPNAILLHAGRDATAVYGPIHPAGILQDTLPRHCKLGSVDPATMPAISAEESEEDERVRKARANMPLLGAMVDLNDFEVSFLGWIVDPRTSESLLAYVAGDLQELAHDILSRTAWAYYKGAGDDEYSMYLPFLIRSFFLLKMPRRCIRERSRFPTLLVSSTNVHIVPFHSPFYLLAYMCLDHADCTMSRRWKQPQRSSACLRLYPSSLLLPPWLA